MRILIVGSGAVGSFLGATLAAGGDEVTLVDRDPAAGGGSRATAASTGDSMLVVEHNGERRAARARRIATLDDLASPPELVMIAVKMFDVRAALQSIERWPLVPVLTVQNGIGAEETACDIREGPVLAVSLTTALEVAGFGHVRRRRHGGIGVALVRGDAAPMVDRLVTVFAQGGLASRAFGDAVAMKWSKLLGNLVGNATSAIVDLEPGAVYADARLFAIERSQVLEALSVMAALGRSPVALPGADARLIALAFRIPPVLGRFAMSRVAGGARGGKWPSLALHVRAGRGLPTEAPWLNGAVARVGESVGVRAPVNRTLARLVDEVAADGARRTWFQRRPDRLIAEVTAASRS